MNRFFTRLSAFAASLALVVGLSAQADAAFRDGNLFFEPIDESTCSLVESQIGFYSGDVVIPEKAYDSTTGITYTVTMVANFAFEECADVTSVTFPETITTIQTNAFNYCVGLTSVTLPASLKNYGKVVFAHSSNLEAINVAEGSKYFKSINGILYNISGDLLVDCPEKITEVDVPASVKVIRDAAFFNCTELERVSLPEGLEKISLGAFQQCESLREITIPSTVTTIGAWAFDHCMTLTEFECGENVDFIDSAAFQMCSSLERFVASDKLKSLGESAFMGCFSLHYAYLGKSLENIGFNAFETSTELEELIVPTTKVPEVEEGAFCEEIYENTLLYLLDEAMPLFSDADPWNLFMNMRVYDPNSVSSHLSDSAVLDVTVDGGVLYATAPGEIQIFTVDGKLEARGFGSLTASPGKGLYLVRSGAETRKVIL